MVNHGYLKWIYVLKEGKKISWKYTIDIFVNWIPNCIQILFIFEFIVNKMFNNKNIFNLKIFILCHIYKDYVYEFLYQDIILREWNRLLKFQYLSHFFKYNFVRM